MVQITTSRRARWLVVGFLAALITVVSVAVGVADPTVPTEVILVLEDGTNHFEYGQDRQFIAPDRNQCTVDADTNAAGLVTVEHSTFTKQGRATDGHLGLVEDGLGVNEKGNGNGQDCGRVDFLGSGRSEALSFAVGPGITDQVFAWIDFDLEAKYDAVVRFDFYQGSTVVGTQQTALNDGSDSGPDSKFRDKYRVLAYPGAPDGQPTMTPPATVVPFDRVVITMITGGVSVEGGATWDDAPGDSGDNHRTVFHLASSRTEIAIDASANGNTTDDLGFVAAGTPLAWTYSVTNTGDLPLTNVVVTDSEGLTIAGPVGDDGDGVLSPLEEWTYSASSTAETSTPGGGASHTATATGDSDARTATATDTVVYFGMAPSMTLTKTTTGSDDEGTYSGPGDNILVVNGDTVTWTYAVTNNGNVPLSGIGVVDDQEGAANCPTGQLAPGATATCSLTGVAEISTGTALSDGSYDDGYVNSATASGTHTPTSTAVNSDSDGSGYFGTDAALDVEVSNNGIGTPPVVADENVIWTIRVTNSGNVEVDVIVAEEDLPPGTTPNQCDIAGSLLPGESDECQISTPTQPGEQSTSFTVTGQDPLGMVVEQSSGTVGYFGGLDCGDSTTTGGPELTDTPLAGFHVGPLTKGSECAVPVEIVTTNDPEDPFQSVFIGPPTGYTWVGVTGLLTVEWDIEDPADAGVRPTFQDVGSTLVEVPLCAGDVAVEIAEPAPGDFMYTLIDNPVGDGSYPNATGGGDVCLVLHTTRTINYDNGGTPEVKTLTTEVFYIFNDPRLSRPR